MKVAIARVDKQMMKRGRVGKLMFVRSYYMLPLIMPLDHLKTLFTGL